MILLKKIKKYIYIYVCACVFVCVCVCVFVCECVCYTSLKPVLKVCLQQSGSFTVFISSILSILFVSPLIILNLVMPSANDLQESCLPHRTLRKERINCSIQVSLSGSVSEGRQGSPWLMRMHELGFNPRGALEKVKGSWVTCGLTKGA